MTARGENSKAVERKGSRVGDWCDRLDGKCDIERLERVGVLCCAVATPCFQGALQHFDVSAKGLLACAWLPLCLARVSYCVFSAHRVCTAGAWFDVATSATTAHEASECSGRGSCNRLTGQCQVSRSVLLSFQRCKMRD